MLEFGLRVSHVSHWNTSYIFCASRVEHELQHHLSSRVSRVELEVYCVSCVAHELHPPIAVCVCVCIIVGITGELVQRGEYFD